MSSIPAKISPRSRQRKLGYPGKEGESESIEVDDIFPPLFYVEPIVILGLPLRPSRQNPNEAFHHATLRCRVTGNQGRHAAARWRCTGVFVRGTDSAPLCLALSATCFRS